MNRLQQKTIKNNAQSKPQPRTRNQIRKRSHTLVWRASGHRQIILHASAKAPGFVCRILEGGKLVDSVFGIEQGREAVLEERAIEAGRKWVRANAQGARITVRSTLERAALFGSQPPAVRRRRAA
jgi:hypothetical protein